MFVCLLLVYLVREIGSEDIVVGLLRGHQLSRTDIAAHRAGCVGWVGRLGKRGRDEEVDSLWEETVP